MILPESAHRQCIPICYKKRAVTLERRSSKKRGEPVMWQNGNNNEEKVIIGFIYEAHGQFSKTCNTVIFLLG